MSIFRSLFARSVDEAENSEQAVIIELNRRASDLDVGLMHNLEARLAAAVDDYTEVDGHDLAVDGSCATIYIYGPSAESTWASIEGIAQDCASAFSVQVILRFGSAADQQAVERRIKLSPLD